MIRGAAALALLIAMVLILNEARIEIDQSARFHSDVRRQLAVPPAGLPRPSQKSIEIAMTLYGIEVPDTAVRPRFSQQLADRGLSMREPWDDKIKVEIGPSAFTSWALLGSTLAHELEVHCKQNFVMINFLDSIGLDGTGEAERQAYMYELHNARRFGLEKYDVDLILATMNYYYPSELEKRQGRRVAGQMTKTIGKWLARRFIVQAY